MEPAELACALASTGLDVLMWAGLEGQRAAVRRAGLELAPWELLAPATARGAELEGITAVLLLTDEDDFNAWPPGNWQALPMARSTGSAPASPAMAWSHCIPAVRSCSAPA